MIMSDFHRASHAHLNGNCNKGEQGMSDKKPAEIKLSEATKVRDVESLLSLHNDEQTTREINRDWQELRSTVDGRASHEERKIKAKMTITGGSFKAEDRQL